ncbi:hypothetical protein GPAL_2828 [Glaciecola pallidula DSM 14239 = ACAM 615]|uniref:Smr domain-containing protein n=1 Tax=Brumicola pallidula DSM 14239 = ACAM 615 TaxID=1121922 RepID=K6YAA2_9ALTE|nr:hypothetical protein GPAL_2828 [Glaciecola pallidula DSM 14239 = ACAM 615]
MNLTTLSNTSKTGLNSEPIPAFLKSYVNQWLRKIDMVIAFHTALKQSGG